VKKLLLTLVCPIILLPFLALFFLARMLRSRLHTVSR
jgi:hypothetical protein